MRNAASVQTNDGAANIAESATTEFIANRLATETFLRGVDLLNELVGGEISHGMLLNALWCLHLSNVAGARDSLILPAEWNEPLSIHRLARALQVPYPTVHRHLAVLIGKGMAVRTVSGQVEICEGLIHSKIGESFRRRSIASVSRFLVGLHRIGVLTGNVSAFERENGLTTLQEDAVFRANMEIVLSNLLLTSRFYGGLLVGLLYKLVSAANVRHLREVPVGVIGHFPDELRRPISIYSAAKALHMSYETTRRISKRLLAQNTFVQIGDQGVIAPAEAHRRLDNPLTKRESFRSIAAGIAQIQRAGLAIALVDL